MRKLSVMRNYQLNRAENKAKNQRFFGSAASNFADSAPDVFNFLSSRQKFSVDWYQCEEQNLLFKIGRLNPIKIATFVGELQEYSQKS
jgi:hypothetical protein